MDALERLLNSCVALGLIEKKGAVYSNLPVARTYLTRSSPDSLTGYILYSDRVLYTLCQPRKDGHYVEAFRRATGFVQY